MVTTNFTEGDSSGPETMRLLDTTSRGLCCDKRESENEHESDNAIGMTRGAGYASRNDALFRRRRASLREVETYRGGLTSSLGRELLTRGLS